MLPVSLWTHPWPAPDPRHSPYHTLPLVQPHTLHPLRPCLTHCRAEPVGVREWSGRGALSEQQMLLPGRFQEMRRHPKGFFLFLMAWMSVLHNPTHPPVSETVTQWPVWFSSQAAMGGVFFPVGRGWWGRRERNCTRGGPLPLYLLVRRLWQSSFCAPVRGPSHAHTNTATLEATALICGRVLRLPLSPYPGPPGRQPQAFSQGLLPTAHLSRAPSKLYRSEIRLQKNTFKLIFQYISRKQ